MRETNALKGLRIAAPAVDGFEKVELTVPVAALKLEGAKVDIVSLHGGRIRGMNLHEPTSMMRVDKTLDRASPTEYDGLLIPDHMGEWRCSARVVS